MKVCSRDGRSTALHIQSGCEPSESDALHQLLSKEAENIEDFMTDL